ncbi:MAG TPA: DUF1761 domain-containing protein [Candidatus Saccharimonadales bacterium]|nr:DUF1761 domain-containing protein [Candidatus Saccharimonadales bacterium]
MPEVDINVWAVIVAAIINMVAGSFWYSRKFFGKEWAKLTGRKIEEMGGGGRGYAIAAVGSLVQAYILAHFVQYAGSTTIWTGLVTGFWLWLGFVAVVAAVHLVFERRPWALWRINTGYFLAVLLINGALLAAWR